VHFCVVWLSICEEILCAFAQFLINTYSIYTTSDYEYWLDIFVMTHREPLIKFMDGITKFIYLMIDMNVI